MSSLIYFRCWISERIA